MKRILDLLRFWGLLILAVHVQIVSAQPFPFRFQHLSVDQGLSHNTVYAITQDKHGLIWIGTEDGLNCFDGYKVEVYRNEPGNRNSLPNNLIRCLFTDSRGVVWAGTSRGLACYDSHSRSFRTFFQNITDSNSLSSNWIRVINEDANGILWIGTFNGLCSFDLKTHHIRRYLHNDRSNSISNNEIRDIKFTPDGMMWITTARGLNCFNLSTKRFISFFHDPYDSSTLSGNGLSTMTIDEKGNLWTYLYNTLYLECFNTKTFRCSHFLNFIREQSDVSANFLRDILIDRTGRFWVATNEAGLSQFFPGKNFFYEYRTDPFDPNKLHSNTIFDAFQDSSGMIWLATFNGVERFNPDDQKFIHYQAHSFSPTITAYKWVRAITEDSSNRLWIGSLNGISVLARNTGNYTYYQWKRGDPYSLSDNSVRSLCCDKQGNIWIGTAYGLNLFDPIKNNFRVFYAENNNHSLAGNFIMSIICSKNGDLLIASNGGFTVYNVKTRRFANFKSDSLHRLLNVETRVVFEDNQGRIWLGTGRNGLLLYNPYTNKVAHFFNSTDDTTSLATNFVLSIAQDHKGVIWIGTESGLCRFNELTQRFTIYSERNGLPNVHTAQLLVDDKDRIWLSTNKGISMLNESRTGFTNYDPSDGLQGWEFNDQSAYKTHDGYFCYCGKNGFNLFRPDFIKKNSFKPPVILKRIMIFDDPLKMDSSYSYLKSLKLSYRQNFFSFEFAALNYDHPEKNKYACQLIGFDKKLIQLGTNRVISYTNVPHNSYTLKVIASNNDELWNEEGFELKLVVTPPFWATWWFRTTAIVSFVGIVFLFFRVRENRIKKEQARQTAINKQIAEIRMIALRAQMDPHFIFNSLNSIQHFITAREKEEALNYLSKFSKLIRKILENSRENTVSISNELQLLELYIQLEQLRFNNKFDYHIKVDEKIDMENTEIPPLLIQPYIENAILHGLINKNGKGDLWVSLEKNDGFLNCKIEDNGIGRIKAEEIKQRKIAKHRSLGMKVTSERIAALSALLDYKMEVLIEDLYETNSASGGTSEPAGTRVIITIPIKEED